MLLHIPWTFAIPKVPQGVLRFAQILYLNCVGVNSNSHAGGMRYCLHWQGVSVKTFKFEFWILTWPFSWVFSPKWPRISFDFFNFWVSHKIDIMTNGLHKAHLPVGVWIQDLLNPVSRIALSWWAIPSMADLLSLTFSEFCHLQNELKVRSAWWTSGRSFYKFNLKKDKIS